MWNQVKQSNKQNEDLRGLWSENGNQFGQRLRHVENDFIIMQIKCLSVQCKATINTQTATKSGLSGKHKYLY